MGRAYEALKTLVILIISYGESNWKIDSRRHKTITVRLNIKVFYLPKFPPATLDFLAVATDVPLKICLAYERLFCVKNFDIQPPQ